MGGSADGLMCVCLWEGWGVGVGSAGALTGIGGESVIWACLQSITSVSHQAAQVQQTPIKSPVSTADFRQSELVGP